jgi:hypothetical protein
MVGKTCELVERVKTLDDPRQQYRNLKHRLEDILVLGFCGTLGGCEDFAEIVAWANLNLAFFRTFLTLPRGIPSHDTFNRVFAVIPSATLQEVLLALVVGAAWAAPRRMGAHRRQDHASYTSQVHRTGRLACRQRVVVHREISVVIYCFSDIESARTSTRPMCDYWLNVGSLDPSRSERVQPLWVCCWLAISLEDFPVSAVRAYKRRRGLRPLNTIGSCENGLIPGRSNSGACS